MLREREQPRPPTSCSAAISSSLERLSSREYRRFWSLSPGRHLSRLTFAKWLAGRDAPTTARSLVNRVWQAYFGTGIVASSEDLGVQCEPPSHPELLDWLAVEFMDSGWSLKHLHRLIAVGDLSPIVAGFARCWPAIPTIDCSPGDLGFAWTPSWSRHRSLGERAARPQDRRAQRLPSGAGIPVSAAGELRPQGLERSSRPRTVSPGLLHVPLSLGSLPNAPGFRCAQRRLCLRSPRPVQYTPPGPTTLNEPIYLECARALALWTLDEAAAPTHNAGIRLSPLPVAVADRAGEVRLCSTFCDSRRDGSRRRAPIPGSWPRAIRPGGPSFPPGVKPLSSPPGQRRLASYSISMRRSRKSRCAHATSVPGMDPWLESPDDLARRAHQPDRGDP